MPVCRGGRIELTEVNVAERDFAGVSEGWSKYYFVPWREHLTRRRACELVTADLRRRLYHLPAKEDDVPDGAARA
jgi:hypothetical protein